MNEFWVYSRSDAHVEQQPIAEGYVQYLILVQVEVSNTKRFAPVFTPKIPRSLLAIEKRKGYPAGQKEKSPERDIRPKPKQEAFASALIQKTSNLLCEEKHLRLEITSIENNLFSYTTYFFKKEGNKSQVHVVPCRTKEVRTLFFGVQ